MKPISIYGKTLTPEFWGDFGNASIRENVVLAERTRSIQKQHAPSTAEIGWTFDTSGGARGIYIQYSSGPEISCQLLVDGEVVQHNALFETTFGTKLIDWRYQCTVDLAPGTHTISLRATRSIPHVYALAVASPPSERQASVDEYYERLTRERSSETPARPFMIKPHSFAGMLGSASRLAGDDAAIAKLASVAALAVKATQHHVMNGQAAIPWGGPLNGQRYRQHVMERLMRVGPDSIIETGTFLGTSTAFFARHGLPVHSCELRDEYFAAALSQLTSFENVSLYLMDSRAFLREIAADASLEYKRPFFYLDAHWYDDLPLADEIRIIQERWQEHIIMVDDFCVPEAGYNFDRYPNGLELTLEHLDKEGVDLSETAVLFPTASHTAETSARRGTLVLTPLKLYEQHLTGERSMFRYVPGKSSAD